MDNERIVYGSCDKCNEDFPIDELEECPSSWYEDEHGITLHRKFCRDCCEGVFESEGCQSDVDNCDRATEIMAEHIKKYAEDKGFSLYKGKPRVYLDDFRVLCIADNGVSVEEVFEDKLILLPHEDFELWEGKETYLVKPFFKEDVTFEILYSIILVMGGSLTVFALESLLSWLFPRFEYGKGSNSRRVRKWIWGLLVSSGLLMAIILKLLDF